MMVAWKLDPSFDASINQGGLFRTEGEIVCRDLDEQLVGILQEGAQAEAGLPIAQAKTILGLNMMELFYRESWAYTDATS
jgi:hypothetical protein